MGSGKWDPPARSPCVATEFAVDCRKLNGQGHEEAGGRGKMQEKRRAERRVLGDRRKGERRVMQVPVEVERRAGGDRRKGERRVVPDRRKTGN